MTKKIHLSFILNATEEVDSCCYLGSYITKDGGASTDSISRSQEARQSFGRLCNVMPFLIVSLNNNMSTSYQPMDF